MKINAPHQVNTRWQEKYLGYNGGLLLSSKAFLTPKYLNQKGNLYYNEND